MSNTFVIKTTEQERLVIRETGIPGPVGPPGPVGGISPELSLFLMWEQVHNSNFETFTYLPDGTLTDLDLWADDTLAVKVFNKYFNYVSGVLVSIVVTRISDGKTETKDFTYSSGVLVSKKVTQS